MKLVKELSTAAIAILVFTVVLGVAYPLVMTGIAQVAFPSKADGSQVKVGGRIVGSRLIGKAFTLRSGRPDPRYFQPRPSQIDYSATASAFSNRGPNSAVARFFYRDQLAAYVALEGRYDPGLTWAKVPVDGVTTSASGVDPQISAANARIQANRVAERRNLPLDRVLALVNDAISRPLLGLGGPKSVNVVKLNDALEAQR